MKEKIERVEKKINDEIVNSDLFSHKDEDFIMSRLIGVQKFIIDDSPIVLPIFTMKDLWKQWDLNQATVNDPNAGKRKPKIDLSKFRLGANWRKGKINDEDAAYLEK